VVVLPSACFMNTCEPLVCLGAKPSRARALMTSFALAG
jgi:hypothetical protein